MTEWSQNRVAAVWKNLADAYGPRFLRDFGDAPPQIWQDAIRGLKDHQIAKGFRVLSLHGSNSPPTLPQFVKACKTVGDDEGSQRQVLALPSKMSREQHLARLRRAAIRVAQRETMPMFKGTISRNVPDAFQKEFDEKWAEWDATYGKEPDDYWLPRAEQLMAMWENKPQPQNFEMADALKRLA